MQTPKEVSVTELINDEYQRFVSEYHTEPNLLLLPSEMMNEFYLTLNLDSIIKMKEYDRLGTYMGMEVLFTKTKNRRSVKVAHD